MMIENKGEKVEFLKCNCIAKKLDLDKNRWSHFRSDTFKTIFFWRIDTPMCIPFSASFQ